VVRQQTRFVLAQLPIHFTWDAARRRRTPSPDGVQAEWRVSRIRLTFMTLHAGI
jgi:hypothetical protein